MATFAKSQHVLKKMRCQSVVYIVEDDCNMSDALADLLASVNIHSEQFLSAEDFLQSSLDADMPSCIVMDIRLPDGNGLDVFAELVRRGNGLPVVFMSGFADVQMTVRAMRAGALNFLEKPFRDQHFLDAVTEAIGIDRRKRLMLLCSSELRNRYESLSRREREVMSLAVCGLLNKQIASHLGISEVTTKIHRSRAMRKMQARTFADLVKMAVEIDVESSPSSRETKPIDNMSKNHRGELIITSQGVTSQK